MGRVAWVKAGIDREKSSETKSVFVFELFKYIFSLSILFWFAKILCAKFQPTESFYDWVIHLWQISSSWNCWVIFNNNNAVILNSVQCWCYCCHGHVKVPCASGVQPDREGLQQSGEPACSWFTAFPGFLVQVPHTSSQTYVGQAPAAPRASVSGRCQAGLDCEALQPTVVLSENPNKAGDHVFAGACPAWQCNMHGALLHGTSTHLRITDINWGCIMVVLNWECCQTQKAGEECTDS